MRWIRQNIFYIYLTYIPRPSKYIFVPKSCICSIYILFSWGFFDFLSNFVTSRRSDIMTESYFWLRMYVPYILNFIPTYFIMRCNSKCTKSEKLWFPVELFSSKNEKCQVALRVDKKINERYSSIVTTSFTMCQSLGVFVPFCPILSKYAPATYTLVLGHKTGETKWCASGDFWSVGYPSGANSIFWIAIRADATNKK